MKLSLPLLLIVTLILVCPLSAADQETLQRELDEHVARSEATWREFAGREIEDRILPAPDIILDYLRKDNQFQGYSEIPKRPALDPAFRSDIVTAVTELPDPVRDHMEKHLVAIFLVEELGGTAYTEVLRDVAHNKKGFIVLDVGSLNRRANEWCSWKANSPFAGKDAYVIEAEIEEEPNDTRKAAIQYILLHEVGHLVGVAQGLHPNWFTGGDPQKWPFSRISWLTPEKGFDGTSRFDTTFPNRRNLKFYSFKDALLTSNEIDETYRQLLTTDFVSLYAATNMYDDFAETYAMYVHVVLQHLPWTVRIMKGGNRVREITNPILARRCEEKRHYMDRIFK